MNAPDRPPVDVAGVWNDIAIDLARRGFYKTAIHAQRRSCDLAPERANSWANLGNMLRREGRMDGAFEYLSKALDLDQANAPAHYNMGVYWNDVGNHAGALLEYEFALKFDPGNHDWNFARACALLSLERWQEGFAAYEVRNEDRSFGMPMWDGKPLNGRRLLLFGEQGAGDTIMFHRFRRVIGNRTDFMNNTDHEGDNGIDYVVDWPLASLLAAQPAGCLIGDGLRCHAPLMSLPRILGITEITGEPYLKAPTPRMGLEWPPGTRYKVGLVWKAKSGKKNMTIDERLHGDAKSMPLDVLLGLTRLKGVALFGLQHACTDIADMNAEHLINDLGPRIHDFKDLAAFISEMDVVVSVDTAPAHLAGALGKPVVVCLHNRGAWHWGAGDRSPWYSSARIVACETPGVWPQDTIIAEVEACLASK